MAGGAVEVGLEGHAPDHRGAATEGLGDRLRAQHEQEKTEGYPHETCPHKPLLSWGLWVAMNPARIMRPGVPVRSPHARLVSDNEPPRGWSSTGAGVVNLTAPAVRA